MGELRVGSSRGASESPSVHEGALKPTQLQALGGGRVRGTNLALGCECCRGGTEAAGGLGARGHCSNIPLNASFMFCVTVSCPGAGGLGEAVAHGIPGLSTHAPRGCAEMSRGGLGGHRPCRVLLLI